MKFNDKEFEFIFPVGGDRELDCYYQSRWVEIKKCKLNEDETTEIVVPEGVKAIGQYAFINFVNLQKITFPSSLEIIRDGAFECCKSLKKVEFSNPVTIHKNAFRFCESLESVVVDFTEDRKKIELIWENNRKLNELPGYLLTYKSTGKIWRDAFKDCPNLQTITLKKGMTYL